MKRSLTQVIAIILGAMVLLLWASVASADLAAGRAAYIKGDYALAFQVYKPLAEQGDAEAQYMLGNLYKSGQGAPHDPREVMKWYKRASDQGHRHAQTAMQNYAYMYPGLYIKTNEANEANEINEIIESRARRQARGNSAVAVMTDSGEIVEVDVAGFNRHVPKSKERTGYDEDAAFGEGFEFPPGTTDADLRDPTFRRQLMLRSSLEQTLRQVPAPGQAQISAEAPAKPLPSNEEETPPETAKPRQRESRILVGIPGGAIDTSSGEFYPVVVGGIVGGPATGGTVIVVTPTGARTCVDTGGGMAFCP